MMICDTDHGNDDGRIQQDYLDCIITIFPRCEITGSIDRLGSIVRQCSCLTNLGYLECSISTKARASDRMAERRVRLNVPSEIYNLLMMSRFCTPST